MTSAMRFEVSTEESTFEEAVAAPETGTKQEVSKPI
jgi:hypothetical protein